MEDDGDVFLEYIGWGVVNCIVSPRIGTSGGLLFAYNNNLLGSITYGEITVWLNSDWIGSFLNLTFR